MKRNPASSIGVVICVVWAVALSIVSIRAAAPEIKPPKTIQHQAVHVGQKVSFSITATGDPPLSYQWQLDGKGLPSQTNTSMTITNAQPADEGDYTVRVTNLSGIAFSTPARLFVVPNKEILIRRDFTNETGKRLPYFYGLPADYSPARSYSLVVYMAGLGMNEDTFLSGVSANPSGGVLLSQREQSQHPAFALWPARRSGQTGWDSADIPLVLGIINRLATEYSSISTNHIHLWGYSDGGGASVALLEKSPNLFASAFLVSGTGTATKPSLFKHVPIWVFHCADDPTVNVSSSRNLVSSLRQVGGTPLYSEFLSGGHSACAEATLLTPVLLDWFLEQRLGAAIEEPTLSTTSPSQEPFYRTGAKLLNLAGSARAFRENITGITWENPTSKAKGHAVGTNSWTATDIPLVSDKTNAIIVTATTPSSWTPAYGGTTTFSRTLFVLSTPVRASLALQPPGAVLNWTGGVAPFQVQRASALSGVNWIEMVTNAVPPLLIPVDQATGFYRIVGQ